MSFFTPKEIVSELDKYIIGQDAAKRAVAIAMRNRWRRLQVAPPLRDEILPKNILMIGPTGVGKTEIARRLAKIADSPFIKVEATKFTEVGYVGRDVEQIIRDLLEIAIDREKTKSKEAIESVASSNAMEKLIDILAGKDASEETRSLFKKKLLSGEIDDSEVEIELKEKQSNPVDNMPNNMHVIGIMDMFSKVMGTKTKKKHMKVSDAYAALIREISDDLIDDDNIIKTAIKAVEERGIVFIDEIDKICGRVGNNSSDVSREGVQRDLLPIIEGSIVSSKHGSVKTDHILFIASGAFHASKPSDLLPELQGRLPIRVELNSLKKDDFIRILCEPENSLIKQYIAMLATEDVHLEFNEFSIEEIANLAVEFNSNIENIGARRLYTIMEKLLEDVSFNASDMPGKIVTVDQTMVQDCVKDVRINKDLARFIL